MRFHQPFSMRGSILVLCLAALACGCGSDDTETVGEATTTTVDAGSCRGNSGKKLAITRGHAFPNRGAFGVALGMSRAEVIDCIGHPVDVLNKRAVDYSSKQGDGTVVILFLNDRVVSIEVGGPHFCFPHGICTFKRHAVTKLRRHYRGVCESSEDSGREVLVLHGELNGREVQTAFFTGDKGDFYDFQIAYRNQSAPYPCNA